VPHLLSTPLLGLLAASWPIAAAAALPSPQAAPPSAERCAAAVRSGDLDETRRQRQLLQADLRPPLSLEAVLQAAAALLACAAPDAALDVLARISPAPGDERRRWLLMQWQAAQAGLHHDRAAQALQALAGEELAALETLLLPLDGSAPGAATQGRLPAIDLLADHLESLGQLRLAVVVLLSSRQPGAATAARWGRAAQLASGLPPPERDAIVERALELAAASEAWGLVAELLDQQLAAGVSDPSSARALERRLRLGARIDDVYGEWLQRRRQSAAVTDADQRLQLLDGQLRSPRGPGGHAAPAPEPSSSSLPPTP
jgi:hypothetical protein